MLIKNIYAAGECKLFKCGSITQGEGKPKICTQKDDTNFKIDDCSDDELCMAVGWANPAAAKEESCVNGTYPEYQNVTAPGDW